MSGQGQVGKVGKMEKVGKVRRIGRDEKTDLEPVHGSTTGLIRRGIRSQHLDHQALASVFHALFEECLNLIGR